MSEIGYSRITLKIRDEWEFRDTIKLAAEKSGESVNAFMIKAIRDAVKAQGLSFPVPVMEEKK